MFAVCKTTTRCNSVCIKKFINIVLHNDNVIIEIKYNVHNDKSLAQYTHLVSTYKRVRFSI